MAKAFVVIRNNNIIEGRYGSKQDAEAAAEALRDQFPRAYFEFGKLDKKLYNTVGDISYTPVDEVL